jgi:peroxiredoxin Q/BCP
MSTDTSADNLEFKAKNKIPFPLLCDIERDVSLMYGACAFRKAYYAVRVTYLIDENGNIRKVFPKVHPANHAKEVLGYL